jgi:hypothetical protein
MTWWFEAYYRRGDPEQGQPDTYTFISDERNDQGDTLMCPMPDSHLWPYSPILYGEYHVGGDNSHLGERVTLHELAKKAGGVIIDRFFSRVAYQLPQDKDGDA